MHATSIDYDVTGVAGLEIRRFESANAWSRVKAISFGGFMAVSPKKLLNAFAGFVGNVLVAGIHRETLKLQSFNLQFSSLKADLAQQMRDVDAVPDASLVAALNKLLGTLHTQQATLYNICDQVEGIRPDSRVHNELRKQLLSVGELTDTVNQLRLVALGASNVAENTWQQNIEASRQNFLAVSSAIDTDNDFDPELLALAEEAVSASENRKTMEPGWASSLAGSPYH